MTATHSLIDQPQGGAAHPAATTGGRLQWYCLRTRYKREQFAARFLLERTKTQVFAPRIAVRRVGSAGTACLVPESLFPGYVFCRFDLEFDSRFVLSTPDICGIVRFGEHTPPVADRLIEYLRAQVESARAFNPVLVPGDWVEVLTSCLSGSEGRVVSFDNARARAAVLLQFLGQEITVQFPVESLRKAGPTTIEFPPQLLAAAG